MHHSMSHDTSHRISLHHMICHMWWCDVAKHGLYCVTWRDVECCAMRCGIMLLWCGATWKWVAVLCSMWCVLWQSMVWYHCNTFHIAPHHIPHANSISQNTWHSTPHLTGCAVCGGTVWQSMVCTVLHEEMWCNVECCAVRCGIMLLWCGKAWYGNTVTHPISHSTSHHTTSCTIPYHKTTSHCAPHSAHDSTDNVAAV